MPSGIFIGLKKPGFQVSDKTGNVQQKRFRKIFGKRLGKDARVSHTHPTE